MPIPQTQNDITSLYNRYTQKYPMYNRDAIADIMVEYGDISPEIAVKIKQGVPLFLIKESLYKQDNNFDISLNMGACFSKKTASQPVQKPNINRKIEPTFQSDSQGDCWLLSDVNALNLTEWGRKILQDAIIPYRDGNGVTIKFPGSPLTQKNFHISAEEITEAKKSGHYSTGDDDMIALELAVEKVSKGAVNAGIAKRVEAFDEIIGYPSYLTNIIFDDDKEIYLEISQLLTGRPRITTEFLQYATYSKSKKNPTNILRYLSNNQGKVAAVCTFNHYKDLLGNRDENDIVLGNHAYTIKRITYGKEVVVINPYNANKEIKLSWNKFIDELETLFIEGKDDKINQELKQSLPKDYDEAIQSGKTERREMREQLENETKEEQERKLQEQFDKKLNRILFDYTWSLLEDNNEFAFDDIKCNMERIDKETVLQVLEAKPNLIEKLDKYMSGWGNKKNKKALITPIINALAEKAKEVDISNSTIDNFKKACNKELDTWFYTDEQVINNEVNKIVNLIKSKEIKE